MPSVNVILSLTVEDGDGEIFAVPIYGTAADTATIANLITGIGTLANLVDDVIDGKIVRVGLRLDLSLPAGLKGSAVAGSEVERTGLYNFSAINTKYDAAIDVPAMALSTLVSGSNTIDPANAAVTALVGELVTSSGSIDWTDKYGNSLDALKNARKTFRKHRRSTSRN